jgi:hypothetical protein
LVQGSVLYHFVDADKKVVGVRVQVYLLDLFLVIRAFEFPEVGLYLGHFFGVGFETFYVFG